MGRIRADAPHAKQDLSCLKSVICAWKNLASRRLRSRRLRERGKHQYEQASNNDQSSWFPHRKRCALL